MIWGFLPLFDRTAESRLEMGRERRGSDKQQMVGAGVELATATWRTKPALPIELSRAPFWLHFCVVERSGDASSIFICADC